MQILRSTNAWIMKMYRLVRVNLVKLRLFEQNRLPFIQFWEIVL